VPGHSLAGYGLLSVDWIELVRERVRPSSVGVRLATPGLTLVLVAALAAVLVGRVWRVLRLAVTLVHELGHAVVGMAVGRRFVGFVLRGDMSGHAITSGPARGPGRVLTTWSGYPAPPAVGAAMIWLAVRGWSAPAICAGLAVSLLAATRVRSALTACVVAVALAATAALWWWRDDTVQQQVVVGVGVVLVVGGWRHLGAVLADRGRGSDPAVLATLTHLPRGVWNLSFIVASLASSWLAAGQVLAALR
jgi:Peptidase M50B-like